MATASPQSGSKLNTDMVISIATKVVLAGGAILVSKNLLTTNQLNALVGTIPEIVGALAVLLPMAYGIWKTSRGQKIASAAALPGATVVLDNQAEADKHPTASVVGPDDIVASTAKPAS